MSADTTTESSSNLYSYISTAAKVTFGLATAYCFYRLLRPVVYDPKERYDGIVLLPVKKKDIE